MPENSESWRINKNPAVSVEIELRLTTPERSRAKQKKFVSKTPYFLSTGEINSHCCNIATPNSKLALGFALDNFSRFILNFQVSEKVSAEIRMQSIKQAYEQYIMVPGEEVRLIVDGGVENNNNTVDDYISSEEVSVQKLIAGKDIKFSNSMVEAQNKIIKYYYLFKHDPITP